MVEMEKTLVDIQQRLTRLECQLRWLEAALIKNHCISEEDKLPTEADESKAFDDYIDSVINS